MSQKTSRRDILTTEELVEQGRRSELMRKHFREAIQMHLDDIGPEDPDSIGIFLSGGVDSTTLLWDLIDLGVRPKVFTYRTPLTEGESTDHKKAKYLADEYGLDFHLTELPDDPDYVGQTMERLFKTYIEEWRTSRPDKEVPYIMHEMTKDVVRSGVKHMFSGIGESNFHLLSRKLEIRGRAGRISDIEMGLAPLAVGNQQLNGLSLMLKDMGVNLLLPHLISAPRGAFFGASWQMVNLPRVKAITLRAYEEDEKRSGLVPVVSPMQTGNSGARQYFDAMIPGSQYVVKALGRSINTSQPFYNLLESRYREVEFDHGGNSPQEEFFKYEWANHVQNGAELDPKAREEHEQYLDLESGVAKDPEDVFLTNEEHLQVKQESMEDDIFGDGIIEDDDDDSYDFMESNDLVRDEDGTFNKNIDCFGYPLWMATSQRDCPYARKGFCSSYKPEIERELEKCSSVTRTRNNIADYLENMHSILGSGGSAYLRAAEEIRANPGLIENEWR